MIEDDDPPLGSRFIEPDPLLLEWEDELRDSVSGKKVLALRDPDGTLHDRDLHEKILSEGTPPRQANVIRIAKMAGLTDEEIKSLYMTGTEDRSDG